MCSRAMWPPGPLLARLQLMAPPHPPPQRLPCSRSVLSISTVAGLQWCKVVTKCQQAPSLGMSALPPAHAICFAIHDAN